ncbi:TonB-dependent siderophore receptor [Kordiimonas sp. SCSIO 12610]|uniref:TonB-dependent receptor n=1 Tax=Kordiimonas sp. SCSIO 12610 TaxID=2829597 RepID=UPI00210D7CD7|nr:TonB-dependent siderophore receptor [Kordiimonas sp. SCSIO 12610]UTW54777.1 TonB-dependent siderophore receptor [Kordiimonas sp. SCSIO 12610]
MSTKLKSILYMSTIMVSLTGTAYAQDVNTADQDAYDAYDEEIIVTGRYLYSDQVNALKTPTPIIDVPQSLSIITADQIVRQGIDSISDITLYTPGITSSQGEGHRDAVVFRGVRSTADFYLDGVRDDVQYYRSLYNLEQVEVLRGPNALLFGRGGTGGLINRVTKKGVIGEDFVGYLGSVDTFGAYTIQADANFTVSDNAAFRINGYYESLNNHRDFFDGDRYGINPTARIELSDATTLNVSYEYNNNERFVDRGIPAGADGRPAEQLVDITFGDPELNTTTFEGHTIRATVEHEFSESLKGNFNAFYGDYDKLYSNFFPVSFNEDTNVVGLDGYIDTTQRKNLVLSTNLVGEFKTGSIGHTFFVGGEYIDTSNNNDRFNAFFDQTQDDIEFFTATRPLNFANGIGTNASGLPTANSFNVDLNDDTEADVEVFSVYIQDQIEISEHLDLLIGGRFDSFDITVDNIETFIETGERDIRERRDSEFSPRLGLVFKPQENISIYGSFSESFLPRSGEQFADINPPDDALDPNTFQTIEAGLKWDFANGLSFTAAIFENEQSSPQVADNDPGTLDVIDSEIRGIEAQIQGQITDQFFITAGYSYLEGNQVNDDGSEGLRVRELPEHTFNIWGNYQVTDRLGFGVGLTYQDESFADNGNNTTLPDFVRIDAAAYYDLNDSVRLQVNIENLTDTEYFPNAHTANNITVGAPLNARFTITGRF